MRLESNRVGMLPCRDYDGEEIAEGIGRICSSLGLAPSPGTKVLLKPNLVMAGGHNGLACTHPEFVAAAARSFLDHGVRVTVGDSPAFGSAVQVMHRCGILQALEGLGVKVRDFRSGPEVRLQSGQMVRLTREAFEADLIVNLPRIKAHVQLGMTLSVKNLFGLVVAWRKWLLHQSLGADIDRFLAMLVDILEVIPDTFTLLDGIIAMQGTGPVRGVPFRSGIIAGSWNPVALDTSSLKTLSLHQNDNLLSREYLRRGYSGCGAGDIEYTLSQAGEVATRGFAVPARLKPIPFSLKDSLLSLMQRGISMIYEITGR